jgi:DNA-binding beta-propeller fold protein YncE
MSLEQIGEIALPRHSKPGGFDHAAVHGGLGRLYVAHTANSALDVIDCRERRYLRSIPGLTGVAGVLVAEAQNLVFTSNRRTNTVGILSAVTGDLLDEVSVGIGPNGLAYDSTRHLLVVANVGDPAIPGSHTVSLVDLAARALIGYAPVPGRTRWALFDPETDAFYVNIADPPMIAVLEARAPDHVHRTFPVPVKGPHGLDLDARTRRLFCACDGKVVVALDAETGSLIGQGELSGGPDVIFFNADRRHLYVAIGDPGVIEVWDTERLCRLEIVPIEPGAHTIGFDSIRNMVYAFLPESHRAAIYQDGEPAHGEDHGLQDRLHSPPGP